MENSELGPTGPDELLAIHLYPTGPEANNPNPEECKEIIERFRKYQKENGVNQGYADDFETDLGNARNFVMEIIDKELYIELNCPTGPARPEGFEQQWQEWCSEFRKYQWEEWRKNHSLENGGYHPNPDLKTKLRKDMREFYDWQSKMKIRQVGPCTDDFSGNRCDVLTGEEFPTGPCHEQLGLLSTVVGPSETKTLEGSTEWINLKPKFSVCIIGKNESKTLPKALKSLEEFKLRGGEIMYVDTGSTDNSVEIAKSFGAKTEEVGDRFVITISNEEADNINSLFIDKGEELVVNGGDRLFNFSAARNYSASLASNDMIATLDCDEEYTVFDITKINKLIDIGFNQFEYEFIFSHDENSKPLMQFRQSKFYDRRNVEWIGTVHEVLRTKDGCTVNKKYIEDHICKLEHWQNAESNRRHYLTGLAVSCFRDLNNDRNSHYFARELMGWGRQKSAMREFKRHISMNKWATERTQSMIFIGDILNWQNNEECLDWYFKAYNLEPNRREALIKLAEYFNKRKQYRQVVSYTEACLGIPDYGFYMNNTRYYVDYPYELLYMAYWYLGERAKSKYCFDKAYKLNPLYEIHRKNRNFFYPEEKVDEILPTIDILIPTLGREDGLKKCLDSIEKLDYPKELIRVTVKEDEPRIGVPKRFKELVEETSNEWIVFAANDTEFDPSCLKNALEYKDKYSLIALNTGEVQENECNICAHFMIRRSFIPEIGGEVLDTEFNHLYVDNLLWAKAKKLGQAIRCENAILKHNYSFEESKIDNVHKLVYNEDVIKKDKELYDRKIKELELCNK